MVRSHPRRGQPTFPRLSGQVRKGLRCCHGLSEQASGKRHAEIETNAIEVTVHERNKVVLEGKVGSWDKRDAVENAALSSVMNSRLFMSDMGISPSGRQHGKVRDVS